MYRDPLELHRDPLEMHWLVMRGKAKEYWDRLTEEDLDLVGGQRQRLIGRIQQRYGRARDEVEKEVDRWVHAVDVATLG